MLIEHGVPVALATDVNPGGGFSPSMPFAMALGCFGMNLTFEEALVAATINAAYSLDRHDRVGSLEPGKQMDAVIVDGPAIDLVRVGADDDPRGDQEREGRRTDACCSLTSSVRDLLCDAFSSSDPTPGGGSAAALASAVGASLLMMVAALPKTRGGTDDDRAALASAAAALAGHPSAADRRRSTPTPPPTIRSSPPTSSRRRSAEEQAARKSAIQQALRAATDVPLDVVRLSAAALAHGEHGRGARPPRRGQRRRRRRRAAARRAPRRAAEHRDQRRQRLGRGVRRRRQDAKPPGCRMGRRVAADEADALLRARSRNTGAITGACSRRCAR